MGRKRCSSYVESSDDEFQLSDAEPSPNISRLKRPKRAQRRDGSVLSTPVERSILRDDDNSSIVIPDSLDQDDKSIPEYVANAIPSIPNDSLDDDTRETERPSEIDDSNDEKPDMEEVEKVVMEADQSERVKHSPKKDVVREVNSDDFTTSGSRRKSRKVYHIESDSEVDSENGNDDDEAYNSAADSPPEDDDDSEFEFSPRKPAKKKEKTPAKHVPRRQNAQKSEARKLATRKPAVRKLATKAGLGGSSTSRAVQAKSKSTTKSEGVKPRLGARLPHRGLLSARPAATERKGGPSSGKLPSTAVIRSGLSRKAAIPRLHAYLPR